jgi:curli biogenesis system outer membrane secretion channel CsgG
MKRPLVSAMLLVAAAACGGCGVFFRSDPADYVKPSVAVFKFENRAPFPLGWDLGDEMKEMLFAGLVETNRYRVIERLDIDAVKRELRFQHGGSTRQQGRAKQGRLKNVQYLIKGTITDFGHVSGGWAFSDILDVVRWFSGSQRAIMSMTVQVIDVESGEIVTFSRLSKSVKAGDVTVELGYQNMAMGGSMFRRTPLGRATASVIDEAVEQITDAIANRRWIPKVATLQNDGTVVLNGGQNRKIKPGMFYEIRQKGQAIVDPESDDVLGYSRGRIVGWVKVVQANELYSIAEVVGGDMSEFQPGQLCRATSAVPSFSPDRGG